jgi:competence ComEA-like helix-hairpin-helix protein
MPSRAAWLLLFAASLTSLGSAAELPDGAGKDILLRACVGCHKAEDFRFYRHTKEEYQAIVQRMAQRGARASSEELDIVADYLAANFLKVEDPNKTNVNKASAHEIETRLNLTAKEAEAIVSYRERHGDYHAWGDLLLIYGVDGKKIEAVKERIGF